MRGAMRKNLPAVAALVAAALPAQLPSTSPIATETLVVRGRCVDFDTGVPLARCRVALTGHQSTGYAMAWSRTDWADPPEVTTGPDGTFRFEVRLPAADEELDRGRYHVQISHAHHAGWFSHCAFVIAQAQGGVDYGDVRLPAGVWPRIRCEDPKGAPQPGVLVDLRPAAGSLDERFVHAVGDGPHWWIERGAYARTDIDGYLHLEQPLPPGDYTLAVREREARTVPGQVKLPQSDAIVAVVAPVDTECSILGRLVDESGQPVEGASLSDGGEGPTLCTTRRDGAFTLINNKPTGRTYATLCLALNRRFDGWLSMGEVEWGRRDVELVLPAKTLHTFVVRTQSGAPVESFNLYCQRRGPGDQEVVRLAGTFAGGRAPVRLPDGDYEVRVVPRSDRILASDPQAITIDAAHEEIAVEVPDAVARTVEVRFADDHTAAAGALVEAIAGGVPPLFAWVRPDTVIERRDTRQPELRMVASARTDARGRATLRLRDARNLHLRVTGASVRTMVQAADLTDDKALPIDVERGATLFGTIGPLTALRALDCDRAAEARPSIYSYHSWTAPTLTVVLGGGQERREGIRIDPQGRFRCDGLPPGPVELQLRHWAKEGRGRRLVEPPSVLGSWTLRVDAPQSVELQLPAGTDSGR
jgi:hypothetical protein